MNNFIKLGHAIIVFFAIQTVAFASVQNSENGFCVPAGQAVTLSNAVVIVNNHKINNYPLEKAKDYKFFDFVEGSKGLRFSDSEGSLSLVKSSHKNQQGKKIALFTETTPQGLDESILVECRGQVIKDEATICPTDPKTCAYYYCRHRWPPAGCQ